MTTSPFRFTCRCTAQGGSVYRSGCPVHDNYTREQSENGMYSGNFEIDYDKLEESHRMLLKLKAQDYHFSGRLEQERKCLDALYILDSRKVSLPEGSIQQDLFVHLSQLLSEVNTHISWNDKMYLTGNLLEFFSRRENQERVMKEFPIKEAP